jgi:hypothetical protein
MHPFIHQHSPPSLNSADAIACNGLECLVLPSEELILPRKAAMPIFWSSFRHLPIALR